MALHLHADISGAPTEHIEGGEDCNGFSDRCAPQTQLLSMSAGVFLIYRQISNHKSHAAPILPNGINKHSQFVLNRK